MKKNALIFFESTYGHHADLISKEEAIELMEEYAECSEPPLIVFKPAAIVILSLLFLAGAIIGSAVSFAL